ncbi:amidohydrolase family protein [Microbispora siamensis]|uniref:2-hydroxy-3-carboxy-6-oxo-7-methylocta-2, 4-dienoa te decarboxylase n=1 Tax=Microbispora siamensis TaxID=564413 RepID=A0ABQ4GVM0_9ACTN|nr:amidohydrolase family protein [Microbispora siamensis]GIH65369.1 2-hydroxy-3-carboxy-6-oxo-7-methylocta-2,4-dienoa te decarboxylase [Microbispora siamensis]
MSGVPPAPGPVTDVHAHALPTPLLTWLAGRGLADLSGLAEGVVRIDPLVSGIPKGAPIPLPPAQYDVAERLEDMRRMGVTRQLVSVPPFVTCADAVDEGDVLAVVRRGNDALAELLAGHRGVLDPLGYVPLGTPAAPDEARRCLDELGCAGIAIGTRGLGRELDDPVHEPLWELLADRRTFVFLHPNSVPGGPRLADYWLSQLAGFPMETALAVSRLVFGGVLERHDLRLCLAHGGGCLPSLSGRLDLGWSRKPVARTTPLPPSDYLRRLYYDTATFSAPLLRRLVEDFGVDHVLVGTDYPFELADTDPLGTVAALGLGPGDAAAVRAGTANALLTGST